MRPRKTTAILLAIASCLYTQAQEAIDLSGTWKVKTTLSGTPQTIQLPATLDMAGIGEPTTLKAELRLPDGSVNREVMRHLTRKVSYVGLADYEREVEVNREMAKKPLQLTFERVLWRSRLYVDGQEVGNSQESLSTPHVYLLPKGLSEGKHHLRLTVDNTKQYDMSYEDMAHAYTDETQTKWNGILGRMELSVVPLISDIQVYPDANQATATVKLKLTRKVNRLRFFIDDKETKFNKLTDSTYTVTLKDCKPWDEFNPVLYRLTVSAADEQRSVLFGMRNLTSEHGFLELNGKRIFLRSTLECCIFPLTGCPPTTEREWQDVFSKAKAWGLNSLRFHSYCPPEAAFAVADRMGFYLQVELPNWTLNIGENPEAEAFFRREFDRISQTYGNHPSFCLMTCGNELQKDFSYLNDLCRHMKATDPRHLYATTSFTFEKGHGGHPEPEDQFFITQWTDKGWVRGQGVFDTEMPNFRSDYNAAASGYSVPLISHEIGQYSVYPNMAEIGKYTGTLAPLNFLAIWNDLKAKHLLHRAADYTRASGQLAVKLYKEEIERALKTRDMNGYQLLGLQDFPGQSTALVGLVDAFWDSKGLCDEAYFRQFCAPVVPLARFDKATWSSTETFSADIEVANYSTHDLLAPHIQWSVTDTEGNRLAGGALPCPTISKGGLTTAGSVSLPLSAVTDAAQLTLHVSIDGTPWRNSWNFWAYAPAEPAPGINITTSPEEAIKMARAGKDVLLHPARKEAINGLEGKFLPVFWSPVHFPKQAGTMGLLLNPRHPALRHFPTGEGTDWQWWNIVKRSRVMNLDSLQSAVPLIESVDNFVSNRRLALCFEARLGKGRIVVASIELATDLPEVRHLLYSLSSYMLSTAFSPRTAISEEQLRSLFTEGKQRQTDAMSIYE